MAEGNLPLNKKWIYLYNKDETTHPYTGKLTVDKDSPLMPGQTIVEPQTGGQQYFNEATNQWVDQVVLTYEIKADKHLGATTRHPAGYVLQSNETFTKPKDGLYDPQWNGSDWVGISKEEYYKKHPIEPAKPNATQQTLNVLGQQVATLTAENQQLKETLKSGNEATQQLGMQVATLIAKDSTANGGTN